LRKCILGLALLVSLLLFIVPSVSALTAITNADASPADDATNVWVNTPSLSVLLNSTEGGNMNGTITLVATGDVLTITNQPNGTQTLTIASANLPLEASTTYQWWVNVSNNSAVWVNTSYNFTTGSPARMSENTGWSASELLLITFLGIAVLLVIVFMGMEIINNKKPDLRKLMGMLIAVIIMVIAMGFI
jgi:hypothetical protein